MRISSSFDQCSKCSREKQLDSLVSELKCTCECNSALYFVHSALQVEVRDPRFLFDILRKEDVGNLEAVNFTYDVHFVSLEERR